jgi:inner membrane protease subunit 1
MPLRLRPTPPNRLFQSLFRHNPPPKPAIKPTPQPSPNRPKPINAFLTGCFVTFIAYHALLPYATTGPSMLPHFPSSGACIIMTPFTARGRNLRVGDIVAAHSPYEAGGRIVKRVVGMPGDVVCVNEDPSGEGDAFAEPGVAQARREDGNVPREFGTGRLRYLKVPTGHVWLSGDNAPASLDSRHYGPVPLALVIGKVWVVQKWSWPFIVRVGSEGMSGLEKVDDR